MSIIKIKSELYRKAKLTNPNVKWVDFLKLSGEQTKMAVINDKLKSIKNNKKNIKKSFTQLKQSIKNIELKQLRELKIVKNNGIVVYDTNLPAINSKIEFDAAKENQKVILLEKYFSYIQDNLSEILKNTLATKINLLVVYEHYDEQTKTYSYHYTTKTFDIENDIITELHNGFDSVGSNFIILKIEAFVSSETDFNQYISKLKAFSPNSDISYHKETLCSTTKDRLCIYQTYYYLYVEQKLISKNNNNIKEALKNESTQIKDYVKNGELLNFCKEKSKELNKTFYIKFFKNDKIGFSVLGDEIKELTEDDDLKNKLVFLYSNNHVAPSIYKTENKIKPKENKFKLIPKNVKKFKTINKVLGFDIETYKNNDNKALPYCLCLSNGESFYSNNYENVIKLFCDYLDSICTKVNMNKHLEEKAVEQILLYGFNNSAFDNIFILKELKKRNPCLKTVIMNNTIKYIKYHNIRIYDIKNYYAGSLERVAKNFKLEISKGVFPYDFPNENNLYYNGDVPDIKYWNSKEDRDTYIKENGNTFNLKDYTIKYCILDCKLVYEVALKHLKESYGEINNKKYDCRLCSTGASTALKLFTQTFQKEILYESPENILEKERNAYYGGRTEVFKKEFKTSKDNKYLYYYDINSSYPYAMTKMQPYQYKRNFKINEKEITENQIVDYYLYNSKVEYIGNDKYFIPNIINRTDKKEIVGMKNNDYNYHWGIELKEAINNNCKITCNEIVEYEGKNLFEEYANYFYNERLKNKKTNISKAEFYKLLLNSLYGKFGQKIKPNREICDNQYQVNQILNNKDNKLCSFENFDDFILINYSNINDKNRSIGNLIRFSSYITATARTNLSIFMRDVGHKNVYYCDTDSCFTTKKPNENLINESRLGAWKAESDNIIYAKFLAPKTYFYNTEDEHKTMKAKGLPQKNVEEKLYIDNYLSTEIKSMFFRSLNGIYIKPQVRTIKPVYNKRIWKNNNSYAYDNIEDRE